MTDYAFMEAYKADTLDMLYRSMEIISEYPEQVIVLKGTGIVRLLSGRASGVQKRLIDVKATKGFSKFYQHLVAARATGAKLRAGQGVRQRRLTSSGR